MNIIETNLKFKELSKRSATNEIFLHHAAGKNFTVEDIHRMHLNRGWSGIGYHLYIRQDGSVYRGRPIDTVGAHAEGSNSKSVGVCFEGNFENEIMSDAQKQAGKEVVAYLKDLYKITKVRKHKDVNATACPGKNFPFDEIANAKTEVIVNEKEEVADNVYVVKQGDTLWDIAEANNTTVAELAALNKLDNPSLIKVGQKIVLPSKDVKPTKPEPITSSTTNSNREEFNKNYRYGKEYTVNAKSGLNLRNGYGEDTKVIVALPNGTKVMWYGYYQVIDSVVWRKVKVSSGAYTGKVGYVSGKYLK